MIHYFLNSAAFLKLFAAEGGDGRLHAILREAERDMGMAVLNPMTRRSKSRELTTLPEADMSRPNPNLPDPSSAPEDGAEYDQHWVELRDRLAKDGITLHIPRKGAKFNLPEPIEVEGETASEILIRWRHAE